MKRAQKVMAIGSLKESLDCLACDCNSQLFGTVGSKENKEGEFMTYIERRAQRGGIVRCAVRRRLHVEVRLKAMHKCTYAVACGIGHVDSKSKCFQQVL